MQSNQFGLLQILSLDELLEVFQLSPIEKSRLIIGGYADYVSHHLILFRGDGTNVIAPFDMFKPSGTHKPNFHDYEFMDFGNTVRLGSYLASTRSILFDLDEEYKEYVQSLKIDKLSIN